jgi:rhamnose utilization protein RhaD (predicted bifunctional aldolase and dehydrogenase)
MSATENEFLLQERVRTSRLLGKQKSLVLHGGGNTSVKILEKNVLGEEEEILYVKGSGWDLETIQAEGFSPVRLEHLKKLSHLPFPVPIQTNQNNPSSPRHHHQLFTPQNT